MSDRVINPHTYEQDLNGYAPCNYGLNSHTLYRSLARPKDITTPLQVEAFYKYDSDTFRLDYAFRTFPYANDSRLYNMFMISDKGIFKEDITRSIIDNEIYMRWSVFVTKLEDRFARLIITNKPDTNEITWFYPQTVKSTTDSKITITDTSNIDHEMDLTDQIQQSLKYGTDYIDVPTMCYVPIYNFRMWYMMF